MLTEQIIKFESRGPGPPGRTHTPTTGYFHDKTKIEGISSSGLFCYLLLKYCRMQCYLLPLTWAKSLTKLPLKCKILNVF